MYRNNKILAIIPARSGSKGLKDKNIKPLNNLPLMAHTILAAISSNVFDDIIVSTDSKVYATIASKYGASVPFLRPKELSSDTSSSCDTILHTLRELKKLNKTYDYFIVLQPTSPLRKDSDIVNALNLVINKNANAIVSICQVDHPSFLNFTLNDDKKLDGFSNTIRRQDSPTEYRLNGAIYISKVDYYLQYKDFYKKNCLAYVMDRLNSVDIDDIYDFLLAEEILKLNQM